MTDTQIFMSCVAELALAQPNNFDKIVSHYQKLTSPQTTLRIVDNKITPSGPARVLTMTSQDPMVGVCTYQVDPPK